MGLSASPAIRAVASASEEAGATETIMKTAQECWEQVVKYSERVLDEHFSRGQRALWDHLADSWRACAQRVELLERQREGDRPKDAEPSSEAPLAALAELLADDTLHPRRPPRP